MDHHVFFQNSIILLYTEKLNTVMKAGFVFYVENSLLMKEDPVLIITS